MLKRTDWFTKSLAIAGTVIVAAPILSPLVFTRWQAIGRPEFNFDWLLPAEMFPIALLGGLLLLAAAVRSHARRRSVAWGLAIAIGVLVGGQVIAIASGMTTSTAEPSGWPLALVNATIALYVVGLVEMAVSGVLLVRDLFHHDKPLPAVPAL